MSMSGGDMAKRKSNKQVKAMLDQIAIDWGFIMPNNEMINAYKDMQAGKLDCKTEYRYVSIKACD